MDLTRELSLSLCVCVSLKRPELELYYGDKPFIVVGLKTDIRDDLEQLEQLKAGGGSLVTQEQVAALVRHLRPRAALESSAKTQSHMDAVIDAALEAILDPRPTPSHQKKCAVQ